MSPNKRKKKLQRKIFKKKHKPGDICSWCHEGKMKMRNGAYGMFLGCSLYPSCNYTSEIKMFEKADTALPHGVKQPT